jgi:dipeptidyl aminopeptidase/acylaminoacyl peptidase
MLRWSILLLLCAACSAAAEPAVRVKIDDFAALPILRSPILSPDGRQIAARAKVGAVYQVAVLDADHPDAKPKTFALGDIPIGAIHWAGPKRLLVEVVGTANLLGMTFPTGRLLIIDLPSGAARVADRKSRGIYGGDVLYVAPAGDSAVIASQDDAFTTPSVKRIDLATGDAVVIEKPRTDVWDWFADDQGAVRGGVAYDKKRWKLWYRPVAGQALRSVQGKFDKDDDSAVDRFIFSRDGDKGTIVTNERTGRFAAYHYTFSTGQIGEAIFEDPAVDVSKVIVDPTTQEISGIRYHDDRWKTFWVDPKLKLLQARVDRALPGADNQILGDPARDSRVLVLSSGASNPGTYFLFDQAKATMGAVLQSYERIDREQLAPVSAVRYRARDGLEIRGYLTIPKGAAARNLPLIMFPHGGPFVRDEAMYDPFVQFLANRGYAVFQPQFRGSTGFGKDFVERGYGQWGRKMQDDLDDGLDWLVSTGQVDPKRVCIVGASYGGYAALWGAIRNPERYRCAASVAGVTDLEAQLRSNRKSFTATRYFKEWRTKLKGDERFDLKSVSPLMQAARLKVPVLIAHGEKDQTVPVAQGRQMVKALAATKADVTSVFYKDGEHDFTSSEDLADFLRRLEAFLAKHNPA